jgi:hypothetical protein
MSNSADVADIFQAWRDRERSPSTIDPYESVLKAKKQLQQDERDIQELCETYCQPKPSAGKIAKRKSSGMPTWFYLLATLLFIGFLWWGISALVRGARSRRSPTTTAVPSRVSPVPMSPMMPPVRPPVAPSRSTLTSSQSQQLAQLLQNVRTQLQATQKLTSEQQYILSPAQLNRWKLISTKPSYIFVFPNTQDTMLKRPWELVYEYDTENLHLTPLTVNNGSHNGSNGLIRDGSNSSSRQNSDSFKRKVSPNTNYALSQDLFNNKTSPSTNCAYNNNKQFALPGYLPGQHSDRIFNRYT